MSRMLTLLLLSSLAGAVLAYEERIGYPIGSPKEINRMRVAAVYLLPIDMEPRGMDLPQSQADVSGRHPRAQATSTASAPAVGSVSQGQLHARQ